MIRKSILSALLTLIVLFCIQGVIAEGLGINISLPEQGGTFVDMIKEHHRWLNSGWSPLPDENFDALGWPTSNAVLMMDLRLMAEWADEIDDPEAYRINRSGTYSGSFKGQATVQSWGEGEIKNATYDEATNTTTFDFVVGEPHEDGYGFFVLAFMNTRRTPEDPSGSGFTELKLIRPGYAADTDQTYLDEFVYALTNPKFATIRFKDFTATDSGDPLYPAQTEWSDRSQLEHASQTRIDAIGKRGGAAWEYVIELANLTGIDPWINVPVSASAEYITQLATYFKENLNPDLNIYVESSNEVWNTADAFQQHKWNQAQAKDLGIGEHENHARRSVELAQGFETVFGEGSLNDKIRVILCSHYPMLPWWVKPFLTYLENNYGDVSAYIYAISCQSYFGGGADDGESIDKILEDCRADINDQINDNGTGRKKWIQTAKDFGLKGGFCFYEGGPDHGGGSTVNLANRIMAERSEGMGELVKYTYNEGFFGLGGNIAIQFTLTSAYTRYGCWGLTDDISNPDRNYKFQAARDLINMPSSVKSAEPVSGFALMDNYPNPFNPSTQISFSLSRPEHVTLNIFNILGEHITTLLDGQNSAGTHRITFDAAGLPGGIYLYELEAGNRTEIKKCLLVK